MPLDLYSESIYSDVALDRARAYVVAQLKDAPGSQPAARRHIPGPAITVARETGCGAQPVVERLAVLLQQDDGPQEPCKWTVFDRQLIEKVLEEHHLPTKLAPYISGDRRSVLAGDVGRRARAAAGDLEDRPGTSSTPSCTWSSWDG